MIQVTFPDGTIREYEKGTSALQIAMSISEGLARNVLAARVNGQVKDAVLPINENCELQLLTWNDTDGKSTMWHSSAHLMAEALEFHFPGVKLAIGPPVNSGFYYDVDFMDYSISEKDLEKIEQKSHQFSKKFYEEILLRERNLLPLGSSPIFEKVARELLIEQGRSLTKPFLLASTNDVDSAIITIACLFNQCIQVIFIL